MKLFLTVYGRLRYECNLGLLPNQILMDAVQYGGLPRTEESLRFLKPIRLEIG